MEAVLFMPHGGIVDLVIVRYLLGNGNELASVGGKLVSARRGSLCICAPARFPGVVGICKVFLV